VEAENAAIPDVSCAVPIALEPSLNVTVPVRDELLELITEAVNVTWVPANDGFWLDDRLVEVGFPAVTSDMIVKVKGLLTASDGIRSDPLRYPLGVEMTVGTICAPTTHAPPGGNGPPIGHVVVAGSYCE